MWKTEFSQKVRGLYFVMIYYVKKLLVMFEDLMLSRSVSSADLDSVLVEKQRNQDSPEKQLSCFYFERIRVFRLNLRSE